MLAKTFRIFAPAFVLIAGMLSVLAITQVLQIDTVSFAFLLGFPIISGCVILHFRPKGTFQTVFGAVAWLIGITLLAVLGSFASGLEGLICVAMAMVPILMGTLFGGIIYITFKRWRVETTGSLKMVTVPLLAIALLDFAPGQPKIYEISNSIIIDARTSVVFGMLKTIPDISPQEIPTRMSHLLGVPKPTSARWEEGKKGAVRHSYWGNDVHFLERITHYEENRRIAWDFEFPKGWAAEGIEDPHVTVGGKHFDVLSGEYVLEDLGGQTRLILITRTYDSSKLGYYAKFWHVFFFEDFHEVILSLVKARTEALL